jgi:hypothetical protein
MSEIKVNKISPRTNCGTTQLGDSGDTITIPAGVTISNSGTASGFGSTGEVSWNTTKITADPGPAVSGVGYFTDTSASAFNVTLPSSPSAGAVIAVADYANTWDANNLTILRNGSNIEGAAENFVCNQEGAAITFVYVDAVKGWVVTNSGNSTQAFGQTFISATGGSEVVDGNCRIHTFTGPGTFTVSSVSCEASNNVVSYLVVGGGGGGSSDWAGGGGAGGFRETKSPVTPYTASPKCGYSTPGNRITVTAQAYPITVGSGGAGGSGSAGEAPGRQGANGLVSTFSTISSAGGGTGGIEVGGVQATNGGSGGGAWYCGTIGNGNTPPVTPPQGNNGGAGGGSGGGPGGGGGGATAVGGAGVFPGSPATGGPGGAGATTNISGNPLAYAGGGGGNGPTGGSASPCGTGGAGSNTPGTLSGGAGTTNRGGGGGAGGLSEGSGNGGTGGSGVVIIRYKIS